MRENRFSFVSVDHLLLLCLSIALFCIRLHYAGVYAESWDSVDFALALRRYDIFEMQPHFPGYPLYILIASTLLPWAGDPVLALSWLSAAVGSLSLFPLYSLTRQFVRSRLGTWLTVLLFAASPLFALTFAQPMSEALGLFGVLFLEAYLLRALSRPKRNLLGITCTFALLFALLLGVRVSYFPVGFLLLLPLLQLYRERKTALGFILQLMIIGCVFLAGLLAWLLPTAATEGGLVPFLTLGIAFTSGHFTDWGGTQFSSHLGWGQVLTIWLRDRMLANGLLGMPSLPTAASSGWTILLAVAQLLLLAWGLCSRALRQPVNTLPRRFMLLAVLPYVVWILLGQNSEKARHLLPILPWLLIMIGSGFGQLTEWLGMRKKTKTWAPLLLALLMLVPLALRQEAVLTDHLAPPPALQLVDYVKAHYPKEGTLTYTWEEQRLFDYYAPDYETERLQSYSYFVQSVLLKSPTTSRLLVTNAVLDGFGPDTPLRKEVREVARFTADPFIYPTYHTVILYELPAQAVQRIREGKY